MIFYRCCRVSAKCLQIAELLSDDQRSYGKHYFDTGTNTYHTQHFVDIWTYDHPATTESRTDARALLSCYPCTVLCARITLLCPLRAARARDHRGGGTADVSYLDHHQRAHQHTPGYFPKQFEL